MNVKRTQLVIIPLEGILNPVYSKLEISENKIGKIKISSTPHYRNKDLKQIFGLSDNTILKYREIGILPYTSLDNIFDYSIEGLDEGLKVNSNWGLFKKRPP